MVQPKVWVAEPGFAQVAYDSSGRQVYYETTGGAVSSYQTVAEALVVVVAP